MVRGAGTDCRGAGAEEATAAGYSACAGDGWQRYGGDRGGDFNGCAAAASGDDAAAGN